jgi:hypothetical protein
MGSTGPGRRRPNGHQHVTVKDVRYSSAPSFSFGGRHGDELDTLSSNGPFYQFGTHRCPQGEEVTDAYGKRDDKHLEALKRFGRQWKTTPGPGAYRTPRGIGTTLEDGPDKTDIAAQRHIHGKPPSWSIGNSLRVKAWHTHSGLTMNGESLQQHEGPMPRPPTPIKQKHHSTMLAFEPKNITPGPGHYFKRCSSAPSSFSDFHRPQGISLEADFTYRQ